MKYILILFLLFTGSHTKNNSQLLGTWVGMHSLVIQLNTEKEVEASDSISSDEFPLEETIVDSLYKILPSIVEFSPKGKMLVLGSKLTKGEWENKNNEIRIKIDSLLFKGEIQDSTLIIEAEYNNEKMLLSYRKVNNVTSSKYKRNKIKTNTFLKTSVEDSIINTCYFINSENVVIKDLYGIHKGKYKQRTLNGITKLILYNQRFHTYSSLYLFPNSNKSIFVQKNHFRAPKLIYGSTQKAKLLSKEQRTRIQNQIIGSWSTVSSFAKTSQQNREGKFSELKMELEFTASELSFNLSGTENAEKRRYEMKGKWNLSPTGEYLTFWHNTNTPDMIEELIPINNISNTTINIGFSYKSLLNNYEYFTDSKIKLVKNEL